MYIPLALLSGGCLFLCLLLAVRRLTSKRPSADNRVQRLTSKTTKVGDIMVTHRRSRDARIYIG